MFLCGGEDRAFGIWLGDGSWELGGYRDGTTIMTGIFTTKRHQDGRTRDYDGFTGGSGGKWRTKRTTDFYHDTRHKDGRTEEGTRSSRRMTIYHDNGFTRKRRTVTTGKISPRRHNDDDFQRATNDGTK